MTRNSNLRFRILEFCDYKKCREFGGKKKGEKKFYFYTKNPLSMRYGRLFCAFHKPKKKK